MRFLLLVAICSLAALAAADDKKKREILPGDPRYGTENHNHHKIHENELEVSRSLGGYVGSFSVPEVKTSYGPPNHVPGKPVTIPEHPTVVENSVEVSSPSYGVPQVQPVKPLGNDYLPPVVEATKTVHFETQKPAVEVGNLHTDYVAPSIATPVSSYSSPSTVEVKTEKEVHSPVVSYGVPAVKVNPTVSYGVPAVKVTPTVSYGVPAVKTAVVPSDTDVKVDTTLVHTTLEKTVVPEVRVHDHVHEQKTIQTTEVKAPLTLPTVSGVVHDTPVVNSNLFKTNTGVFSSSGLSSYPQVAPVSFNHAATLGSHLVNQHSGVNYETSYGLPEYNRQFESHVPTAYANQYGVPNGYEASYPQTYQVPQTYYSQEAYTPFQYSSSVPYPLAKTASFQGHLGSEQKTGPIADFFQETFPNFQFPQFPQIPQFPQLPQFPSFGSLFPTQAPETVPVDNVDVEKQTEQKTVKLADEHVVKSVQVPVDTTVAKDTTVVTKTTKEYTQPLGSNGGYVY